MGVRVAKRARLRGWLSGVKVGPQAYVSGRESYTLWPERWLVAVWEAPDLARSRTDYFVQARFCWTHRPWVWCDEQRRWLRPATIRLEVPCHVPFPEPYQFKSLGQARARARELAAVICPGNLIDALGAKKVRSSERGPLSPLEIVEYILD